MFGPRVPGRRLPRHAHLAERLRLARGLLLAGVLLPRVEHRQLRGDGHRRRPAVALRHRHQLSGVFQSRGVKIPLYTGSESGSGIM